MGACNSSSSVVSPPPPTAPPDSRARSTWSTVNLKRLAASLAPFRPYLRGVPPGLPFQWDQTTLERGLNFTLTSSIGDIDLLGQMAGGGLYEEIAPGSVVLTLFGRQVRCLSLPQLIAAKRAAGRPKDLEVLAELEALAEKQGEP